MAETLHPTLWRTCPVLANTTRLKLFAELVRRQPQCVSELADQCGLTLPVASQSLRALEARGLFKVKRIRRRVEYQLPTSSEAGAQAGLIIALRNSLRRQPLPLDQIHKLATAFTHPTRIQISRRLQSEAKTQAQIQSDVQMSAPATLRHLAKLERRGLVVSDEVTGKYRWRKPADPLGQALSSMALL